jgi:glycosyltransferase involved in cell wall biosynthesis
MEAFYSGKPVISCTDSGGTSELVNDGINGLEVFPTPQAIAGAMDILCEDKEKAERLGKSGLEEIIRRDITWPSTIRKLLS